ncbi:MAG: helix-turn-helix transcriptional regulator [Pseudomonadota bacterium]
MQAPDIVDTLTERLKILMKEYRVKAAPLARAAELNESAVRDILRGRSKNPGIVTLKKIASVLNLRPSALFEAGQGWPVVGTIGPDGVISATEDESVLPTHVENPFFAYRQEDYAALVDRSGSVAPLAFEGDYLIFKPDQDALDEADIGKPCVCELEDGRTLIRVPRLGDKANCYHLTPLNLYGAPEMNVPVQRASRIALALPAAFVPNLKRPTHGAPSGALHEDKATYTPPRK